MIGFWKEPTEGVYPEGAMLIQVDLSSGEKDTALVYLADDGLTLRHADEFGDVWTNFEWDSVSRYIEISALESVAAGSNGELATLEREIATESAISTIETECVRQDDGWYNTDTYDIYDPVQELRYLELRGLLDRHPDNPNLVKISKETIDG